MKQMPVLSGLSNTGSPASRASARTCDLVQLAERKHHLFEVTAVDAVQKVRLVLVGVARFHEHRARRTGLQPCIVAGGEAARAERAA